MNKLFFLTFFFMDISFFSNKNNMPSIQVNTGYEIDQKGKVTIGKQIIKYPGENMLQTIINKFTDLSKYKSSFYKIIFISSIILFLYKAGKLLNKKAKKITNKQFYIDIKFLSTEEYNYAIESKKYFYTDILSQGRALKNNIENLFENKFIYFFKFIPFLFKDLKKIIKESLEIKQKIDQLINNTENKIK
jgi:hypothetical protein